MWSSTLRLVLSILYLSTIIEAYKVLVVSPMPSHSHTALGKGFVRALLNDGHEVLFATPYPDKTPVNNLKYVDLSVITKDSVVTTTNMLETKYANPDINFVRQVAYNTTRAALLAPDMQRVLRTEKIDAVISEWFFTNLEAGMAGVLKCPWILFGGTIMHSGLEYLIDSVQSPAVIPMMMNDYPVPMSFLERVKNTFAVTMMTFSTHLYDIPAQEAPYKEIFGPIAEARGVELPSLEEAVHDVSVLFINSHPSIGYAQSLPPNAFEVGGYHIDPKIPPLPEDLKSILDSSKGVVYFSMGSVVKSAFLPQKTKEALLNIFKDLPYTVLWKFEEKFENVPKNVIVRPWMPQASILAHPNVKLFITHGGLLSCLEAIHYGVPVLAVPVFGDQPSNAARATRKGYALTVPYSENMGPELKEKLNEMLSTDKYYKKAKEISFLFNNRPISNEDVINHYVKLAIETKGAHHLRSTSLQYRWYHRLLIDQLLVLLLIITALYYLIRGLCCTSRTHEIKKQKKN